MKVSVTCARHAPKTHTRCIDTWKSFSVLICDPVRLDFMIRVRGLCQSLVAVDLPAGAVMVGQVQLGILIVRCPTAAEAGRAGSLKSSCDSSGSAAPRVTGRRSYVFVLLTFLGNFQGVIHRVTGPRKNLRSLSGWNFDRISVAQWVGQTGMA